MQYELIEIFQDEQQKFYMLDKINPDFYSEAMIVRTEWQQMPSCVMYKEFDNEYTKAKTLTLKKGSKKNEVI